jgi:uncharacterized protein YjiS (DUF1127 family)
VERSTTQQPSVHGGFAVSNSLSRIRAAYRSIVDYRTRIRTARSLGVMGDGFLKDIGISRADIHYCLAHGSRHGSQDAALVSP